MTAVLETSTATSRPRARYGRRLAWIVLLAVAGGTLGFAVGTRLPNQGSAEVSILLSPMPGNAFSDRSGNLTVDIETESHLPSSDAVLGRLAAAGEWPPAEVIRRRLTARVVPNASVIVLRYRSESATQARGVAEALAAATLAERVERAELAGAARSEVVQGQIDRWEKSALGVAVDRGEASPQGTALFRQRMTALEAERRSAMAPVGSPGEVISVVNRPGRLQDLTRLGLVAGGLVVGGLLGWWVGRDPYRNSPDPLD